MQKMYKCDTSGHYETEPCSCPKCYKQRQGEFDEKQKQVELRQIFLGSRDYRRAFKKFVKNMGGE